MILGGYMRLSGFSSSRSLFFMKNNGLKGESTVEKQHISHMYRVLDSRIQDDLHMKLF